MVIINPIQQLLLEHPEYIEEVHNLGYAFAIAFGAALIIIGIFIFNLDKK